MKREKSNRINKIVFNEIRIRLELEHDLVYLKMKLPITMCIHGKGIKSFKFIRRDALDGRSERTRILLKEAALKLINDPTNDLQEVIL